MKDQMKKYNNCGTALGASLQALGVNQEQDRSFAHTVIGCKESHQNKVNDEIGKYQAQ